MSGNANLPVRRIAVLGTGVVAWSAALALARTAARTEVVVVRTAPHPAALADRLPASLPASNATLFRLGLTPEDMVNAGIAVHRSGEQWRDWGADHAAWAQGFGTAAPLPLPGSPHQLWLQAARSGHPAPLASLYPGSALAAGGRIAPAGWGSPPLARHAEPGFGFDPARLIGALTELARRAGVRLAAAPFRTAERRSDGSCAALLLADESRVVADLFIDAAGPQAPLAGPISRGRLDWGAALPVDRLLLAEQAAPSMPVDQYQAVDAGWRCAWAHRGRAMVALGYRDGITGEGRARRVLGIGTRPGEIMEVAPGRLDQPFAANVIALGDAACTLGPLGSAGLALAHLHLELLIELLPGRQPEPLLVAEYNRRANLRSDRLRDYLAAMYLVRPRRRGEFWQSLHSAVLPDGLAATVAQFARRGLVPHHEEESLSRDDWAQRLIGLGIRPERGDPVAMSADAAALTSAVNAAAAATAHLVAAAPPYADMVARA